MAQSPAHQFGQIIGDVLEAAVQPLLQAFARKHHLYLDRKGPRTCRAGQKCSWIDLRGNSHDLDFVLERGGTKEKIGTPVAFIETAWRRYTKHSRNKAQEIQGAIEPLADKYRSVRPFKGAILAGVFTEGALQQLRSHGFSLLYLPYENVVEVIGKFGVDARSDEATTDAAFRQKVIAFRRLSADSKAALCRALLPSRRADVRAFFDALATTVTRQIERITVLALHGHSHEAASIEEAVRYVEEYEDDGRAKQIARYEITVKYSNGDTVQGAFGDKQGAVEFLQSYLPGDAPV